MWQQPIGFGYLPLLVSVEVEELMRVLRYWSPLFSLISSFPCSWSFWPKAPELPLFSDIPRFHAFSPTPTYRFWHQPGRVNDFTLTSGHRSKSRRTFQPEWEGAFIIFSTAHSQRFLFNCFITRYWSPRIKRLTGRKSALHYLGVRLDHSEKLWSFDTWDNHVSSEHSRRDMWTIRQRNQNMSFTVIAHILDIFNIWAGIAARPTIWSTETERDVSVYILDTEAWQYETTTKSGQSPASLININNKQNWHQIYDGSSSRDKK